VKGKDHFMTERGLVIIPPFSLTGNELVVQSISSIHPLLRMGALYWDKLDVPDNNLVSFGSSPVMRQLAETGVLKRTMVRVHGSGHLGGMFAYAQQEAFRFLDATTPGIWSLAQQAQNLYLPTELSKPNPTLQVELYNLLPVPGLDVNIQDVLNFKQRRFSELLELRNAMDEFYQQIVNSGDVPHAKNLIIDRIEKAISDVWKPMNESFASHLLSSLKVEINASTLTQGVLGGLVVGHAIGLAPNIAAFGGVAIASLKFSAGLGRMPKTKDLRNDFAYVHAVLKEL
jgi:hypothetical protein